MVKSDETVFKQLLGETMHFRHGSTQDMKTNMPKVCYKKFYVTQAFL